MREVAKRGARGRTASESSLSQIQAVRHLQELDDNSARFRQKYDQIAARDTFGEIIDDTAPVIDVRFAYTGREFDIETGLYYYRARYYEAANGRFVSEDPIGFAGRDANLTRYVANGSTNLRDPSGLAPVTYNLRPGGAYLSIDDDSSDDSEFQRILDELRKELQKVSPGVRDANECVTYRDAIKIPKSDRYIIMKAGVNNWWGPAAHCCAELFSDRIDSRIKAVWIWGRNRVVCRILRSFGEAVELGLAA